MTMHPNVSYEALPATQMLATQCVYCGKALEEPSSVERGCGQVCARKYGVFEPYKEPNEQQLAEALQTAPERLAEAVQRELDSAGAEAAVKRMNHLVGYRWETRAEDAKAYIGAAIEIARALGYSGVADKLTSRYIEGERGGPKVSGFMVVAVPGGWRLTLPYIAEYPIWKNTTQALFHAGAREVREGRKRYYDFDERDWLKVLNVLTRNFAGEIGMLPTGETFVVPEQPVPVPAPEGPAAGAPDVATGERPPPPPDVSKGDVVVLKDGREMAVGWIGSGKIGVMPVDKAQSALERFGRITPGRAGYEFIGTEAVELVKATVAELSEVKKTTGAEPRKSEWVPKDREYPEAMFPYQRESALWLDTVGSGVLALDMGMGKCVRYETLVYTPDGPRQIGEIWDDTNAAELHDGTGSWKPAPEGLLVYSWVGEHSELRAPSKLYRERVVTDLCRVSLDDGSTLECTQPHPVLTTEGWKRSADLQIGHRVAVVATREAWPTESVTAVQAELVGWQLAEGHESTPTDWSFTNTDPEILARIATLAAKIGVELNPPRPSGKGREHVKVLSTTRLRHVLPVDFPATTRSSERYVPASILRADEGAQAAFLAAFFEAESAICSNGGIDVMSASKRLVQELKWMLRQWGIWLRTSEKRACATNSRTPTWRTYYRGRVSGESLVRFATHINYISKRKRQRLAVACAKKRNTNTEGVPAQRIVHAAIAGGLRLKDLSLKSIYKDYGMSRRVAVALEANLRGHGRVELADELRALSTPALHWARVKSVDRVPHEGYVYDLSVPEVHNYVAEGAVVHNTLVSISVIDRPAVVICPASLRINWIREIAKWRPDLTSVSVGIEQRTLRKGGVATKVTRKVKGEVVDEQLDADVIVLNYELLSDKNIAKLKSRGVTTLIVDEAHFTKELRVKPGRPAKGSKRAVGVWLLAQVAQRRLLLTGTPMINGRPYELFPLLNMVAPEEWPDFYAYCRRYCAPEEMEIRGRRFTNYNGKANLDELRERTQGKHLLRKTKDELDLPDKQRRSIEISLDPDGAKEYMDAARKFLDWVRRSGGWEAAARAQRAEALAKMTALRKLSARGKIEAMKEQVFLHLKSTGRPLVVMGHHKEPRHALAKALEDEGISVGLYPEHGQQAIDRFQDGVPDGAPEEEREYDDVIICSIQAAGVGLTLTRASDMFFIERAWRPFDLVQAEDRIYRIKQKNDCVITYYDGAGTIDGQIRDLLVDKAQTSLEVIDGIDADSDAAAAELVLGAMFGQQPELSPNPDESYEEDYEWMMAEL